jgi:hypothetical protein
MMAPGDTIEDAEAERADGGAYAYRQLGRVAVALTGDHDVARACLERAFGAVPASRRLAALAAPVPTGVVRHLVGTVAEEEERLGSVAELAAAARPIGPRPSPRDVRWGLLVLPVDERAALVLRGQGLDDASVAAAVGTSAAHVDALVAAGSARVGAHLGVGEDGDVVGLVRTVVDDTRFDVDAVALHTVGARAVRGRDRGRRERLAVVAASLVLVGAFVWLAARRPPRPVRLAAPAANVAVSRTTAAPATSATTATATPTSPPTTTPATTVERTTVPAAATTSAAAVTTAATTVDAEAAPAADEPVPETTAPAPRPTAPVRRPSTTVPVATTAPPPAPPAPTAAPPTTAAPATSTAPTTTAAPPAVARLAVTSATCSATPAMLALAIAGTADPAAPTVMVTTPWGTFGAFARPSGSTARWSVAVDLPARFSPRGRQTVTAWAGGVSVSASVDC